jgi:ABC-type glycerol-3-phosphate transport system permease component
VTGEGKQVDAANDTRVAPKNVVIMRMRFGPLNDGHPGAPRLEATVVGSGPAWISTNGRTIKGTWKKTSITKPTKFYDADGNEVTLTVGQTFVQVITTSTTGYPISFKKGSDTPPATPVPSASAS